MFLAFCKDIVHYFKCMRTCGFEIVPGYYITIHIIGAKCSYLTSTSGDHFQHQQVQLRRLILAIIPCKLSNIAVHVYPTLQLMQGKVLLFCQQNFEDKNLEQDWLTPKPQKLYPSKICTNIV